MTITALHQNPDRTTKYCGSKKTHFDKWVVRTFGAKPVQASVLFDLQINDEGADPVGTERMLSVPTSIRESETSALDRRRNAYAPRIDTRVARTRTSDNPVGFT